MEAEHVGYPCVGSELQRKRLQPNKFGEHHRGGDEHPHKVEDKQLEHPRSEVAEPVHLPAARLQKQEQEPAVRVRDQRLLARLLRRLLHHLFPLVHTALPPRHHLQLLQGLKCPACAALQEERQARRFPALPFGPAALQPQWRLLPHSPRPLLLEPIPQTPLRPDSGYGCAYRRIQPGQSSARGQGQTSCQLRKQEREMIEQIPFIA